MPRFLCVTLPYRPPSPGKEPKAEDEKAPRVYSSVAEAERERGLVSEVCGTLEWADQFHFPRSTEPPVKRGLFRRVPNAHDENAPRPGGSARGGGGVLSRGKPKPTRRTTKRTLYVDLSRVDDKTPVTIDCSSSESEVDFLDKVDETSARSESEESESEEAYGDEPVWGKDEDATWHPALEGTKPNLKRKKSGTKKKSTARTKRRVIKKTISSSPPMKYACDADRILFRRGAARALGSRMARAELFGDADDDSTTDDDDDDDDEASVPPPANGDESSSGEKIQPTLENEPETDDDDDDDDDDATREVESSPAAPVLLGGDPKDQPREGGVDERARRLASTA